MKHMYDNNVHKDSHSFRLKQMKGKPLTLSFHPFSNSILTNQTGKKLK